MLFPVTNSNQMIFSIPAELTSSGEELPAFSTTEAFISEKKVVEEIFSRNSKEVESVKIKIIDLWIKKEKIPEWVISDKQKWLDNTLSLSKAHHNLNQSIFIEKLLKTDQSFLKEYTKEMIRRIHYPNSWHSIDSCFNLRKLSFTASFLSDSQILEHLKILKEEHERNVDIDSNNLIRQEYAIDDAYPNFVSALGEKFVRQEIDKYLLRLETLSSSTENNQTKKWHALNYLMNIYKDLSQDDLVRVHQSLIDEIELYLSLTQDNVPDDTKQRTLTRRHKSLIELSIDLQTLLIERFSPQNINQYFLLFLKLMDAKHYELGVSLLKMISSKLETQDINELFTQLHDGRLSISTTELISIVKTLDAYLSIAQRQLYIQLLIKQVKVYLKPGNEFFDLESELLKNRELIPEADKVTVFVYLIQSSWFFEVERYIDSKMEMEFYEAIEDILKQNNDKDNLHQNLLSHFHLIPEVFRKNIASHLWPIFMDELHKESPFLNYFTLDAESIRAFLEFISDENKKRFKDELVENFLQNGSHGINLILIVRELFTEQDIESIKNHILQQYADGIAEADFDAEQRINILYALPVNYPSPMYDRVTETLFNIISDDSSEVPDNLYDCYIHHLKKLPKELFKKQVLSLITDNQFFKDSTEKSTITDNYYCLVTTLLLNSGESDFNELIELVFDYYKNSSVPMDVAVALFGSFNTYLRAMVSFFGCEGSAAFSSSLCGLILSFFSDIVEQGRLERLDDFDAYIKEAASKQYGLTSFDKTGFKALKSKESIGLSERNQQQLQTLFLAKINDDTLSVKEKLNLLAKMATVPSWLSEKKKEILDGIKTFINAKSIRNAYKNGYTSVYADLLDLWKRFDDVDLEKILANTFNTALINFVTGAQGGLTNIIDRQQKCPSYDFFHTIVLSDFFTVETLINLPVDIAIDVAVASFHCCMNDHKDWLCSLQKTLVKADKVKLANCLLINDRRHRLFYHNDLIEILSYADNQLIVKELSNYSDDILWTVNYPLTSLLLIAECKQSRDKKVSLAAWYEALAKTNKAPQKSSFPTRTTCSDNATTDRQSHWLGYFNLFRVRKDDEEPKQEVASCTIL